MNTFELLDSIVNKINERLEIPSKISQDELREILDLEARFDMLREEIFSLKSNLEERIKAGDTIEPGTLTAFMEKHAGRRCPKWREEFEKVAGERAAEAILAVTPVSGGYEKLVIKEIAGK